MDKENYRKIGHCIRPKPDDNAPLSTSFHKYHDVFRPLFVLGCGAPGRDSPAGDTPSPPRHAQGKNRLGIRNVICEMKYEVKATIPQMKEKKEKTLTDKMEAPLATPTDLTAEATKDIAGAMNAILF